MKYKVGQIWKIKSTSDLISTFHGKFVKIDYITESYIKYYYLDFNQYSNISMHRAHERLEELTDEEKAELL